MIAVEALAGKFPFMKRHQRPDWTAGSMLTAAEQLVRFPDPDQQAAAALLDQDAIPPKKAIEILETSRRCQHSGGERFHRFGTDLKMEL